MSAFGLGGRQPTRRRFAPRPLAFEPLDRRELLAAFAPNNLVVVRMGEGQRPLNQAATSVYLVEYLSNQADQHTPRSVVPLPAPVEGPRLTLGGTTAAEGYLTRSADGRYLILAGYDAMLETPTVELALQIDRVVARIDVAQAIDLSTRITDGYLERSIRSATSLDGESFWASGSGVNSSGGVRHVTLGGSTSVQVSSDVNNTRGVAISGGQLYVSADSGSYRVASVGSGLPSQPGGTITNFPGVNANSPNQFVLADLSAEVPGDDTLYIASDATPGAGIQKWSLPAPGLNWLFNGKILAPTARGLTGRVAGGNVQLYFTGNNGTQLQSLTDSTGFNQPPGSPEIAVLATAPGDTAFRGVAFAPSVAPSEIQLSSSQVPENSAAPTAVGVLSTVDANTDSHHYDLVPGLGADDNAAFLISGNTLLANASFDFETKPACSIRVRSTDSDGKFLEQAFTISVTNVNERPAIAISPLAATFVENSEPQLFVSGALVTDPESALAVGSLQAEITIGPQPGDSLGIRSVGTGSGPISVSGSSVLYEGIVIGTIDGLDNGTAGRPLRVGLGASATIAALEALTRSLTFHTLGDNPSTAQRGVTITVSDGALTSDPVTKTIDVLEVNDRPSVLLSGSRDYQENWPLSRMVAYAPVIDVDDADFSGGSLALSLSTGGESTDVLAIMAVGGITLDTSNSKVLYSGSEIGVYSGGTNLADLVINFTTALATPAAAQALLQAIGFRSTSENPIPGPHVVRVVLNDGESDSLPRFRALNVIEVNDAPRILGATGTVSYARLGNPVQLLPDATIVEDKPNFIGAKLRVQKSGAHSDDRLLIRDSFTVDASGKVYHGGIHLGDVTSSGVGTVPLEVTFNADATGSLVARLIRSIRYRTVSSQAALIGSFEVSFQLTDSQGLAGPAKIKGLNVS